MKRSLIALLMLTACTGAAEDTDAAGPLDSGTDEPAEKVCVSDSWWTGGDEHSPRMHPGRNCIQCHENDHGPSFVVAGTVFSELNEPNDCNGRSDIEVEIVDAEGEVWSLTTNTAGNFYLSSFSADPVFPITAVVRRGNKENVMVTPQDNGSCGSCHTADGRNGAPGRVVAP